MPVINHIAVALSYTLLAAAIAVSVPRHTELLDSQLAGQIAAVVLFAFGLIHFALTRIANDRAVAAEIETLRAAYTDTRAELVAARDEARRIHEAIAGAMQVREGQIAD